MSIDDGEIIHDSDTEVVFVGESERDTGVVSPTLNKKNGRMKKLTSTPVKNRDRRKSFGTFEPKKKKKGLFIKRAQKDRLRRRLDEGAQVELSTTGSDLDSVVSDGKADMNNQGNCGGSSVNDFESISSSLADQIVSMLNAVTQDNESENEGASSGWGDSSDPSMDGFIIGLTGDETYYQNPFQLTDEIRKEVVRRSEGTGVRAINWSLSSFDRIGGENTLRSVWAKLKSMKRVKGIKRLGSNDENESSLCVRKKLKESLDLSFTCEELTGIRIYSTSSWDSASLSEGLSSENLRVSDDQSDMSSGEPSIASISVDRNRHTSHGGSSIASISPCHGGSSIASIPPCQIEDESISSATEYSRESEVWEEPSMSVSDSIPNLTSSERDTSSSDSGRSDTWRFEGGILQGIGRITRDDVCSGVVTVTNIAVGISDGFTTDGVVEDNSSEECDSSQVFIPVSSTTDEGINSSEVVDAYIDDDV